MMEIVNWLTGIEGGALRAYAQAAVQFKDDPELARLLKQLSEDEKLHFDALGMVEQYLKTPEFNRTEMITLDDEIKNRVEKPFIEFGRRLDAGDLTKNELINYVITLEFSELNSLFLYSINTLSVFAPRQFQILALNIEHHKDCLKHYIEERPDLSGFLPRIKQLPRVADKSVLVVDDAWANIDVLKAILEDDASVDSAHTGEEALKKIGSTNFSAVLADVSVPEMGGIELYHRAVEKSPAVKDRFVFFTGPEDSVRVEFLKRNNLKFLMKPSAVSRIRTVVKEVLQG